MDDPETEQSAGEEENTSKKEERQICLELIARATVGDAMPIPNTTTIWTNIICEKAKRNHSADKEQEIHWPVNEATGEGQEEEEREEDANSGNYFGVNESTAAPC